MVFVRICITALLIFMCPVLYAQKYRFNNYTSSNGLPQNFIYDIQQKKNGLLQITTGEGYAEFDGQKFLVFNKKRGLQENQVEKLANIDSLLTLVSYFQGGFSLLENGKVKYSSASHNFTEQVFQTCKYLPNELLIITKNNTLFTFNYRTLNLYEIKTNYSRIEAVFYDKKNNKLHLLINGKITEGFISNKNFIKTKIFLYNENLIYYTQTFGYNVAITENNDFLLLTPGALVQTRVNLSRYIPNGTTITNIIAFNGNTEFLISTMGAGMLHLQKTGLSYSLTPINEFNGLKTNYISCLFIDREKNIWVGTYGYGLQKLSDLSLTYFESGIDLKNKHITSISNINDSTILVLGDYALEAIYLKQGKSFVLMKNTIKNQNITWIHFFKHHIYFGTNGDGIYKAPLTSLTNAIQPTKINLGADGNNTYVNHISNTKKELLISTLSGLIIYNLENKTHKLYSMINGLPHNAVTSSSASYDGKTIWINCTGSGFASLQNNAFHIEKEVTGFNKYKLNSSCAVPNSDSCLFSTEGDGVFVFHKNRYKKLQIQGSLLSQYCYGIIYGTKNTFWVLHKSGLTKIQRNQAIHYNEKNHLPFTSFNLNCYTVTPKGNIIIGSETGLICIQPGKEKTQAYKPVASIQQMLLNGKPTAAYTNTFDYNNYNLKINYVGTYFSDARPMHFKYRLLPIDKDWTNESDHKKIASYGSVKDGEYTFQVQCQTQDGIKSDLFSYTFEISLPFWKRWWFIVLCLMAFIAFTHNFIKYRTKRLRLANIRLEGIVREKTIALQLEKENLQVLNEIAERQYLDITASINYAKRIQDSALPNLELLDALVENSFVLFKPKDIVSGDFYWYTRNGDEIFIAAADCTGHGVPGAFMSLIGTTILTKLIKEQHQKDLSHILTLLDEQIKEQLRQNSEGSSKDGMEIGLCKIDLAKKTFDFCSAKRPLYIVENGGVQEIKGSKDFIGGYDYGRKRNFVTHSFELKPKATYYLFSDGFPDQFGGEEKKRLGSARFKEILLSLQNESLKTQKQQLALALDKWRDGSKQIDDILVIGFTF